MAALSFTIGGKSFSFTGITEGSLKDGCLTFENGSGYLGPVGHVLMGEGGELLENICTQDVDRKAFRPRLSSSWKATPRETVEIDKVSAKIADLVVNQGVSILLARQWAPALVAKKGLQEAAEILERHGVSTKGELAS